VERKKQTPAAKAGLHTKHYGTDKSVPLSKTSFLAAASPEIFPSLIGNIHKRNLDAMTSNSPYQGEISSRHEVPDQN
jgi:hypothetical protein